MRILVVEDEESLAEEIKSLLDKENYQAEIALDGDSGLEMALIEEYDLIVLDILLPGINGIEILKEVRDSGRTVPVLLLTAKDQINDKVQGLDAGADDYLTKPFAVPELLARVRTLLRRTSEIKSATLEIDEIHVDTNTHRVTVAGKSIDLTPKEYSILEYLLYNKNRVLSRLQIAEHVWGDNFDLFSMSNFVDVHIKNLRKKIRNQADSELIQTVRGIGYIVQDNT